MNLNPELGWICSLLNKYKVEYWIDSGTLLGLAREGRVIEGDHDIDISMWAGNEATLEKMLPEVKARGYKVSVKNYRGLNFKYKFSPQFKGSSLDIDISLFRKEEDHAWCPQVYCMPYPFENKNLAYYLYALPHRIIQEIFIRKERVSLHNWPWTTTYKVYMMWIPSRFFKDTAPLYDGIPAPVNYEEYLVFRYGKWQIPRKDWFFIFDDGAIKHTSPEKLVTDLKS